MLLKHNDCYTKLIGKVLIEKEDTYIIDMNQMNIYMKWKQMEKLGKQIK